MDDDGPPPLEDMSLFMKPAIHQLQAQHNKQLFQQQAPGQQNQARSEPGAQTKDNAMFSGLKSGFFSKNKNPAVSKNTPVVTNQSALVIPEVQDAMKSDNQEWLTDDLLGKFVTHPTLYDGMSNPKIVQAMELMRTNPKEARDKFGNDPEISSFINSFATLMSGHYSKLASQSTKVPNK